MWYAFGYVAFDFDTVRADVGIGPYGVRSAMVHPTRKCVPGGHTGRPYTPAFGPFVGAACMAARNRVPLPAGVRRFHPP